MITVSTKQELISAIERREKQIIATGEIAASISRKVIVKKDAKVEFMPNCHVIITPQYKD